MRRKLSKSEEKKLFICRERSFDLLTRCEEISDIFSKKEWHEYEKVTVEQGHIADLHRLLESCETMQYLLRKELNIERENVK